MTIKSITVTLIAPMSDHAANRGEKLLGNASSIKRRPDGRVYISGQMQRHALFSAVERLNDDDPNGTYVANGDGPSTKIEIDLRSDLGGYLDTNKGEYSGRRTAPLTATPAVAITRSDIGRDLLVRLKQNADAESEQKQALATNEFSQRDDMVMSFHLDIGAVGVRKRYSYEKEQHIETQYDNFIKDDEHRRRVKLFLEATRSITDYANQARQATSGEPQKVLIVLDTKMSRKAARYFAPETSPEVQANIRAELTAREAQYFLGDDTQKPDEAKGHYSVDMAYEKATDALMAGTLYRPASMISKMPA
ncbi:type I-PGING CRISPR-associated protein Cas7/Csp1 [Spirosoma pollinicola]|uniref:Type I-PGING CRISPR-associated protein Cas7/Csp1 n=1 Tax=Spirosoma pollinicola TaxID=2057025 RepID=A0A2K8YWU2_9BACT|nr:type I-PGING CRISPR-associated protein Cas7/Csp1 [Spirosoma pollinicola]AUD02101.1 type I-PGING CRISPR-associated protein Cas7/Csp1 [Spirosoma pollinicola]